MQTTILAMLEDAKQHSDTAFGNDLARFVKKHIKESDEPDYAYGENDIHRLFRYVRETTGEPLTAERAVINFTEPFPLHTLAFRRHSDDETEWYELYCDALDIPLTDFMYGLSQFAFADSAFPHLSYFLEVLSALFSELFTAGLYHHFTADYMAMLASGQMQYEADCFRNEFLIDASESPDTVEAIGHFALKAENGTVRFHFLDENAPLDTVFRRLIAQPDFMKFLHEEYAPEPLQMLLYDILQILAHL